PQRLEALNRILDESATSVKGKRVVTRTVLNRESVLSEKLRNAYKQFARNAKKVDEDAVSGGETSNQRPASASQRGVAEMDGEDADEEGLVVSGKSREQWINVVWNPSPHSEAHVVDIVRTCPDELGRSLSISLQKKHAPYSELLSAWGNFHSVVLRMSTAKDWGSRARQSLSVVQPQSLFTQGAKSIAASMLTIVPLAGACFADLKRRVLRIALLLLLRYLLTGQGSSAVSAAALEMVFVNAPEVLSALHRPSELEKVFGAIISLIHTLGNVGSSTGTQSKAVFRTLQTSAANITLIASFHIVVDALFLSATEETQRLSDLTASSRTDRNVQRARAAFLGTGI
ncbi:MAG: hypothetical protein Q7U84_03865, partial [Polynucleobacter sp.]|nr:hypothetical protein [Polynucleobacter sp.]